jgi:hypothetical protein
MFVYVIKKSTESEGKESVMRRNEEVGKPAFFLLASYFSYFFSKSLAASPRDVAGGRPCSAAL